MSENKVKLQLRPSIPGTLNRVDKTPSPTKLLINHGKPNFTINRSTTNYKKFTTVDSTDSSKEFEKIVLKRVNSNNGPISPTPVPSTFGIKLKQNNFTNGHSKSNTITIEPEFIQRQKQIAEKIQSRENLNPDVHQFGNDHQQLNNGHHSNGITEKIINKPQFAKISTNRVQKVNGHVNGNENGFILPPGAICGKPYIPEKPINLLVQKPVSSCSIVNGSTSITSTIEAPSFPPLATTMESTNSTVTNFEQKTVVSFSKDLSTEPNRYPDTVKVVKTVENHDANNELRSNAVLEEMAQLKFDIEENDEDVIVTPVIR